MGWKGEYLGGVEEGETEQNIFMENEFSVKNRKKGVEARVKYV